MQLKWIPGSVEVKFSSVFFWWRVKVLRTTMAAVCQPRRALVEIPAPQPKIPGEFEEKYIFKKSSLVFVCLLTEFAALLFG